MHIKRLTISGFKSYLDVTAIEPFSPGVNVVVGRNGAGKSNFFSAIRFVLSDAYQSLTRHERQSLLHEGSATNVTLNGYVEIVFDNSDNRFPTGKPETILRRTIGAQKDEYTFDHKNTPKAEIMSLLESAGFSRSNPYYIVPQGRINRLTNLKDSERLDLLKEIAGTKVYEERREQSSKIMDETEKKIKKVAELLEYIQERLGELETEKAELKEYQIKDRERRCLEYAIHQNELEKVTEEIEAVEEERRQSVRSAEKQSSKSDERESRVSAVEREVTDLKQALNLLKMESSQAQTDRRESIKSKTELSCSLDDLSDNQKRSQSRKKGLQNSLQLITQEIEKKEDSLSKIIPKWEKASDDERKLREQTVVRQARVEALYSKRGRRSQFKSKAERDTFLKSELENLEASLKQKQNSVNTFQQELTSSKDEINGMQERMDEINLNIQEKKKEAEDAESQISDVAKKHYELGEKRKNSWKESSMISANLSNAKSELEKSERSLSSMANRNTIMGLQTLERVVRENNVEGVYGPLYDLFEVDDRYKTAVEATMGNSLFNVVVDTDDTAAQILELLSKESNCRLTFMALNRLRTKSIQYPQADDAQPMISKLRFDAMFSRAFEQIVGKTIICPSLHVASSYARSYQLSAITLDGDQVERKGTLSGGYNDLRRSRLEAIKNRKYWKQTCSELVTKEKELQKEILQDDQEITLLYSKLRNLKTQQQQADESIQQSKRELSTLQRESQTYRERCNKLESSINKYKIDMASLNSSIENNQKELAEPMQGNLSSDEEEELSTIVTELNDYHSRLLTLSQTISDLEREKNTIELELRESLVRRRDQLVQRIESLANTNEGEMGSSQGTFASNLSSKRTELEQVEQNILSLDTKLKGFEKKKTSLQSTLEKKEEELEKIAAEREEDRKFQAKQSKAMDRYLAKRHLLTHRRDECNKNIRELGVLPEEAFDKYTKHRSEQLVNLLHQANEGLKKYSHVNKKAFDQYNSFIKQRDDLLERNEELESSKESIQELLSVLDMRKDEAIERTFRQVARNFTDVFETLVPKGHGRMIMQKRMDRDGDQDDDDDDDDDEEEANSIDNYTGVSIRVSFSSKDDEGLRIHQLSGGQKSLVALATVFAVQKCDPAPFYLFDEVDSNLDTDRRTAVSAMIKQLSADGAQFIITTFRPELVSVADSHWGVSFDSRKVSSVQAINEDHAQTFVESNQRNNDGDEANITLPGR